MKAVVLISVEVTKLSEVLDKVKKVSGVREAFSVAGRADIVAIIETKDLNELSKISINLNSISGVSTTETLIEAKVGE
ncbi:MAG: Lrp/AsnC ligand binding domain-containing protein [Nitrososphaerota archaeon]